MSHPMYKPPVFCTKAKVAKGGGGGGAYLWNTTVYVTNICLFYESSKNWAYYAHVQTVCTWLFLRGEGHGNKAIQQSV